MSNLKTLRSNSAGRRLLYAFLAIVLVQCLWFGWHDFNPAIAQEVVRENIRLSIRGIIQIAVQYLIPIGILAFFISELIAGRAARSRMPRDN
jgi:hypothetical protein